MAAISGAPISRIKFVLCILGLVAAVAILLSLKPIEASRGQLSPLVQLNR